MTRQNASVEHLWKFIIRHRTSILDIFLTVTAIAVTAMILLEIDVFATSTESVARTIETDEIPILAVILSFGMLLFSLRRVREQRRENAKRIAAEQQARVLAMQDPLTGLANRRQFLESLNALIASPPRASHAFLLLDLNRFKQVNDLFGHNVGDQVLIVVAQRLLSCVRSGELVARLGGDEFAILAPHLSGAEAATGIANRIIAGLGQPISTGGEMHEVGGAIGVALFPFPGISAPEVMRRADVALYKAKASETSAMRFFDSEMDRHVRERAYLEGELRKAIAAEDIKPAFQPLVDLHSGAVVAFEALARWRHPEMGAIEPERFIAIAEDAGLINKLGDLMLRESCAVACTWPDSVGLSFNISPVQLKDPTLGLRIVGILNDTGLRPNRLEIEITESALVSDLEAAKTMLGALRDAGVRIALDDFGTGYSSLYHLRNFRVDKIKIDKSFIEKMGSERESAEIVSALVGLGRGLGLTVTAEGIEGKEQNAVLMAQGCEQGQGFLFSEAVPGSATQAFFAEARQAKAG
jgi:diguanylate cyclase (GGDEF)-like protein